ncbi:MAG: hypothetical protein ACREQY_17265 [Candidatus Binatia bacterium]
MKALAVLLIAASVLLAARSSPAEEVQKWRTPDGKLYFGSRPPPGSRPLGAVGRLETVDEPAADESGSAPSEDAEKGGDEASREAAEIREERAAGRAAKRARAKALSRAVEIGPHTVTRGNFNWIVVGVVRNTAPEAVHDVRVGSAGTWVATDPATVEAKGEATFRLEVPMYPIAEDDSLPPLEARWLEQ